MEAFSLLKYWKDTRNGGGRSGSGSGNRAVNANLSSTSIVSTVNTALNDDVSDGTDDDDGPFFDLEFAALPADADADVVEERQKVEERESEDEIEDEEEEDEEDIDELEETDRNMSFSPSDDLFFKGKVIQIDGSDSAPLREMEEIINAAENGNQIPLPAALVKSATKLRVFMLGLKRSKSESKQIIHGGKSSKNKLARVRLKMEEVKVPIISLLSRAPSNTSKNTQSVTEDGNNGNNEEKRNRKEVVQRYLKMVRPLYVKVSKKSECEKEEEGKDKGEVEGVKNAKARLNLKVIARKHLGKSKSAAVHTMSSVGSLNTTSSKKSDDSLLQQQDGIQSAILHCKRSFNSSSSSEDGEETLSVLMRSASEPSQEKATMSAGATH